MGDSSILYIHEHIQHTVGALKNVTHTHKYTHKQTHTHIYILYTYSRSNADLSDVNLVTKKLQKSLDSHIIRSPVHLIDYLLPT